MPRWRVVLLSLCLLGAAWSDDERPAAPKQKPREPHMRALKWLASHQDQDGRWDCDDFDKHDQAENMFDGAGGKYYDVAMTGLALLAFLRSGYTDAGPWAQNPFAGTIRRGLAWLLKRQRSNGLFRSDAKYMWMYGHVIATNAVCEAYALTRNDRYKVQAQQALDYLYSARNPDGGWRYGPRDPPSDTSVTTWCVLAFDAARRGGLRVDDAAIEGARQWVESMTDPKTSRVGYYRRGEPMVSEQVSAASVRTSTAGGILIRMLTGTPKWKKPVKQGAKRVLEVLPAWDKKKGPINLYYWFFATTALKRVGGAPWIKWSKKLRPTLEKNLHPPSSGTKAGSLDPIGHWGGYGGRIMTTAFGALCLAEL